MKDRIDPEQLLRHSSWMKAMAQSLVLDDARAQDLMQQTWLAALKTPPRSLAAAGSWLKRVLRNFAFRSRQEEQNRRRREKLTARPEKTATTADELLQRVELQREIADAVTRLAEPYRSVVVLRFFEGLSLTEIARRQKTPLTTISSRLTKALEQLRVRLDSMFGEDRRAWGLVLLPLLPSKETAVAGATAASTSFPGLLVMEGIVMKATVKTAAVLVSIVLAGTLITMSGILPDSVITWIFGEEALEVSFRPIVYESTTGSHVVQEAEPVGDENGSIREALLPQESDNVSPSLSHALVEAKIVDAQGYPLSGAKLQEASMEGTGPSATSGEDGWVQLALDAGEEGRGAYVKAWLMGYVTHLETVRLEAGRTIPLGTIIMPRGGAIRGQVIDAEGQGVQGAVITTKDGEISAYEMKIYQFSPPKTTFPTVKSDLYGHFTLAGLPAGYIRLWVRKEGKLPTFTPPIQIQQGLETYGVEILLPEVGKENQIRGVVIDPSGEPVPYANLTFAFRPKGQGSHYRSRNTAKKDGSFEYLLEEDSYLSVTAFDPSGRFGPATAERVDTGEMKLVLQLADGPQIKLKVFDEKGNSIEGFKFQILSAEEEFVLQAGESSIEPEALTHYRRPAHDYLVRVTAPLYKTHTAGPFGPADIDQQLDLSMIPLPGLRGRVMAGGSPVEGACTRLYRLTPENRSIRKNEFPCWLDPKVLDQVNTDPVGAFILTPQEAGRYVVRAEQDGFAPAEAGPFTLTPDLQMEPIELSMGQGGSIEGYVVLQEGQDPTGSIVGINRGDGHPRTTRANKEGYFRFANLIPGMWHVESSDEEIWRDSLTYTSKTRTFEDEVKWNCEVKEGKTTRFNLNVADADAFGLEGTMLLDGKPLQGWSTWLCPLEADYYDNLGRWPAASPDPDGRFKLGVAEPGNYRLVIKNASTMKEQLFMTEVYLGSALTPWSCDLSTGSVVITGLKPLPKDMDIPELVYLWEGEITYMSLILPDAKGDCRLKAIPVGTGKLVRPTMESMNPRDWAVAATVQIQKAKKPESRRLEQV